MPLPLVPLQSLAEAKGRLAPSVGPLQRRLLAIAMFEDVIAALQAVPGAHPPGGGPPPPGGGGERAGAGPLNLSLASAGAGASSGNGSGLVVVAADLPLASAAGLGTVLA